jgi:hypothetical protein
VDSGLGYRQVHGDDGEFDVDDRDLLDEVRSDELLHISRGSNYGG